MTIRSNANPSISPDRPNGQPCRPRARRPAPAGLACLALALPLLAAACRAGSAGPTATPVAGSPGEATATLSEADFPTALPLEAFQWSVEIVQGEHVYATDAGDVRLARQGFAVRVTMSTPLPAKLNAFNTDANFQAIQPGFVFEPDCTVALCTGMDVAEERLNPEGQLFVDVQLTHYLYYGGPDDHRWSRAQVGSDGATFERDVRRLGDAPVEQYAGPALYLLLFVNPANPDVADPGELKKITLVFN